MPNIGVLILLSRKTLETAKTCGRPPSMTIKSGAGHSLCRNLLSIVSLKAAKSSFAGAVFIFFPAGKNSHRSVSFFAGQMRNIVGFQSVYFSFSAAILSYQQRSVPDMLQTFRLLRIFFRQLFNQSLLLAA